MSPRELLEQLNQLDEHSQIEAKAASEVGKSALETVCAFANEPGLGGVWLVLGATLDEGSLFRQYLASGLDDPDKVNRDLVSQCAAAFNRPVRIQVTSGQVNGKTLLAAFVPEAEAAEKPIYFQNRPLPGGAFRRIGSSDVRCTDDDLAVFYQERRGESFDSAVCAMPISPPWTSRQSRNTGGCGPMRIPPPRSCAGTTKNSSTLCAASPATTAHSALPLRASCSLAHRRPCGVGFL
jgi:predicted HTH transcriptional regulator